MAPDLLEKLSIISEEERKILEGGSRDIDRSLYYAPETAGRRGSRVDEVDAARVLQNGRIIDIRRHVRFVHFPKHTHNFVEFIYMCQGQTQHLIDGNPITLAEGDLLFLNQHATQEILPAGQEDIAVNFMILPQFFDTAFKMLGNEESALRSFIISCLTEQNMGGNYLYFHVADVPEVQNLMENLIRIMLPMSADASASAARGEFSKGNPPMGPGNEGECGGSVASEKTSGSSNVLAEDQRLRRTLSQTTMGLLFLHLVNTADRIAVSENSYEEELMIRLLNYIESEYRTASLEWFCEDNRVDLYSLERLIKRHTGKTFRSLLQEKRLSQACYLLDNTTLPIAEVAVLIGYENNSFFHRLFRRRFGMSPREYRLREQE